MTTGFKGYFEITHLAEIFVEGETREEARRNLEQCNIVILNTEVLGVCPAQMDDVFDPEQAAKAELE